MPVGLLCLVPFPDTWLSRDPEKVLEQREKPDSVAALWFHPELVWQVVIIAET